MGVISRLVGVVAFWVSGGIVCIEAYKYFNIDGYQLNMIFVLIGVGSTVSGLSRLIPFIASGVKEDDQSK